MRDLIILTDNPITYESIISILKNEFKHYNFITDTNELVYVKKQRSGFELELSPNDVLDDPNNSMDDTIEKCPNKKAYLTNLSYTSIPLAKRIINIILTSYGRMWIQSDEDDDWFGTAQEFIENYN